MPDAPRATYLVDEYVFQWESLDVQLAVERFREEQGDLKADVKPSSLSGAGALPGEKLNLSSARSIKIYANTLGGHGMLDADQWFAILTQACALASQRYRDGEPSRLLADVGWDERPRFLVEPFLEYQNRALLFGDGGVSKSLHSLALGASVATGKSIIPGTVVHDQGPVVVCDWEDEAETHAERLAAICAGAGIEVPRNIYHMRRTGSLHDSAREIRKEIARVGAIFAIVDSVGAACGGDPEKAADVIRTFDAMRSLSVTTEAIHHVTKDQKDRTKPFGSVYAPNLVRLSWRLDREPGRNGEIHIQATNYKGNNVGAIEQRRWTVRFDADSNYRLSAVTFGNLTSNVIIPPPRTPGEDNSLRNRMSALFAKYGPLDVATIVRSLQAPDASVRSKLNSNKEWFTKDEEGRWDLSEAHRVKVDAEAESDPF